MTLRRTLLALLLVMLLNGFDGGEPAAAHPMGNFSINHYARFTATRSQLKLLYVLDMAEIPTVSERNAMDTNHDGKISDTEKSTHLSMRIRQVRSDLVLLINDKEAAVVESLERLVFRPGAGGLETMRLTFTLDARLPAETRACHVLYRDRNFPERTGWKEIIATAEAGTKLLQSTAAANDVSRELTVYPVDPTIAAPQRTEAEFTVLPNGTVSDSADHSISQTINLTTISPPSRPASKTAPTPQDGFTQSISRRDLTPGIVLLSLGLALLFGAFHALSPGHGKAMVAAYLVGSRGTVRHAVFLGAVITLTHTLSVFALGLVTLIAAQYIVPERLYPVLSFGSGAAIVIVGAALFWQRISSWREQNRAKNQDMEFGEWDGDETSESILPPDAPVSLKSLIVLGITGGALPCPSALVVMLGAIALHRIAFGLALICAFSLGLALVLTAIGLLVVRLRSVLERLPLHERVTSRLPILSAALVTFVGLVLIFRALHGQF